MEARSTHVHHHHAIRRQRRGVDRRVRAAGEVANRYGGPSRASKHQIGGIPSAGKATDSEGRAICHGGRAHCGRAWRDDQGAAVDRHIAGVGVHAHQVLGSGACLGDRERASAVDQTARETSGIVASPYGQGVAPDDVGDGTGAVEGVNRFIGIVEPERGRTKHGHIGRIRQCVGAIALEDHAAVDNQAADKVAGVVAKGHAAVGQTSNRDGADIAGELADERRAVCRSVDGHWATQADVAVVLVQSGATKHCSKRDRASAFACNDDVVEVGLGSRGIEGDVVGFRADITQGHRGETTPHRSAIAAADGSLTDQGTAGVAVSLVEGQNADS